MSELKIIVMARILPGPTVNERQLEEETPVVASIDLFDGTPWGSVQKFLGGFHATVGIPLELKAREYPPFSPFTHSAFPFPALVGNLSVRNGTAI